MRGFGGSYLNIVGGCYGLFGLGLALFFASQGAGRMLWPLLGSLARLVIIAVGGWICVHVLQTAGERALRRRRDQPGRLRPDDRGRHPPGQLEPLKRRCTAEDVARRHRQLRGRRGTPRVLRPALALRLRWAVALDFGGGAVDSRGDG